ncbi:MAG TPA: PEP-CTERM sorting domain-containing protein, partial [Phycisphaerae bacterium]|nr:PEP-CTERM sorting domain-containing protein [Phycisphaerae bacterium]
NGSWIDDQSGSTGVVTVDGVGSTWNINGKHFVGSYGNGALNITNGGAVIIGDKAYIGNQPGSTGVITVSGTGSTWTSNNSFFVGGSYGSGVLNITDGGAISNIYGYIGFLSGSTGEVTVDGAGSTWTNRSLIVGHEGSGVLNITGGGMVNGGGAIGYKTGSMGEVTVDGPGSIWTGGGSSIGYEGSGVLNITGGGLVSVGDFLTIRSGDFINMATGGMLALYGEEDASGSLGAFLGLIDGTDDIRYWDYSLEDWDDIANATLGEDYTLSYLTEGDLAGYTMLTVLELILLGDANGDGLVSVDDYGFVQLNFGDTGPAGIHGDANGDGVVSADDYGSVQLHFGDTGGMGSMPVPEPATLSLLVLGCMAMLTKRRRT